MTTDPGPNSDPRPTQAVVIATLMRPEGPTGVQTAVREVRRWLAARGFQPVLVTPMSWGRLLRAPVFGPRLLLDRASGAAGVAWYRFWHFRFLRRALGPLLARPDLAEAVVYAQCPLSARAALERRRPGQRVVLAVHFDGSQADEWVDAGKIRPGGRVHRAIRRTEAAVLPAVDGVVYVSGAARQAVESLVPAAARVPAVVIPVFITTEVPAPSPAPEPAADLVTVGGLLPVKDHAALLRVVAAAARSGRRLSLDVIGDGPLRGTLEDEARRLKVDDRVRFLGRRSDARGLLARHRVYVHASRRESLCIAAIEAMAAGLPVVTTQTAGTSDLIEPGVEGLFWSPDDPEAAARIVTELLDDEPRRGAMGSAGRQRFATSLAADRLGPRLERFLTAGDTAVGVPR